jgi:phosphoribosylanthranilate isomerase
MVKVKICGITNLEDALTAIDLGADALGFNFYRKSPRYIEPAAAKSIIAKLPPLVSLVGIFVNEFSPERVMTVAHALGIGTVQLHGGEPAAYARKIGDLRIIKVFRVDERFNVYQLAEFPAHAFLLDAYDSKQWGGTGKTFNWEVAVAARKFGRVILAGGLNPENIQQAIVAVRPYAVDICSGVELKPGKKDLKKMESLFKAILGSQQQLLEPPSPIEVTGE